MNKLVFFALILLIAIVDQITKHWALVNLDFFQAKPILSFLNFTLAYNTGAAFSFLSQAGEWHKVFFTLLSLVLIIIFTIWLIRLNKASKLQALALSLIIGGALGNLIDRLQLGFVIDFIDFHFRGYHFPVFNIADSSICIGAFLLILTWLCQSKKS